MNKLSINFENCYGINKLEYEFDLEESDSSKGVYSIYAPNGFMKSSFARAFEDVQFGKLSRDIVFPERETKREIIIDAENIEPESIFVIKPYSESYSSEKTSLLLVNEELKKKYDIALKEIEQKKAGLIKSLKEQSGIKSRTVSVESILCKSFEKSEKDLSDLFSELFELTDDFSHFSGIKYGDIFNDKVIKFLESGDLSKELEDYIQTYDTLIEKSPVLTREFNHQNAVIISKSLKDTGFFGAEHTVNLTLPTGKHEVSSQEKLTQLIKEEQDKVITDPDLLKKFTAIDKKLSNAETKKFREYITDHKDLLPELKEYRKLEKKLWIAYLQKQPEFLREFVATYQTNKRLIIDITQVAKDEQTIWQSVVSTFNKRFNVPFNLTIENQDDVILQSASPTIAFEFDDGREKRDINKTDLMDVLSQGERRALYILNLLFEIEVRLRHTTPTLFIVDDIADSFDYKNKYSIVEYLKAIAETSYFKVIFLTHNFDFHRTICGRIGIYGNKRLFTIKSGSRIKFTQEKYQRDVLNHWKTQLHIDMKCVLACIPFARNLSEYCGNTGEYNLLTALLHLKPNTDDLRISDLQTIYQNIFTDKSNVELPAPQNLITEQLMQVSEAIVAEASDEAQLEDKIVLSIAIRLEAEKFMIRKINDQGFVNDIRANQTQKLYERFCNDFGDEQESIIALDQVNLMTPENIHLNSFMYEPILDMSAIHLYKLFNDVKALNPSGNDND